MKCNLNIFVHRMREPSDPVKRRIKGNYMRGSYTIDTGKFNKQNARCEISDEEYNLRSLLK